MRKEESTLTIDKYGTKRWRNKDGELHRIDGPAIEYSDGDKSWYQNGKYHRINGPAIEYSNGDKSWYQNGKRHRIDGPAVEYGEAKLFHLRGKRFKTKEAFFDALNDEEKSIALFSEDFHND